MEILSTIKCNFIFFHLLEQQYLPWPDHCNQNDLMKIRMHHWSFRSKTHALLKKRKNCCQHFLIIKLSKHLTFEIGVQRIL